MASPPDPAVVVVGADTPLGAGIAGRIEARGWFVVPLVTRNLVQKAPDSGSFCPKFVDGDGPAPLVAAIEAGCAGRRVAAVVHADLDPTLCTEARLDDLTPEAWHDRCAGPTAAALATAQAAHQLMAGAGGVLAFVCPSVGLTGAAGHVALSTTSEVIRLLSRSAALRWQPDGLAVTTFAPPLSAYLPPPDAGVAADAADDIASLITYLAGPDGHRLTATTLPVATADVLTP
jgi:NAD(P)-dependent dehydrogenase (short-subunit alcohol dehydrogenase family)